MPADYFLEGDVTMMQPMDIKSQNFGKGLFGYKKIDVDQYVDTVYRAYDELFTENKNLRDERDRLKRAIEENRLKIFELEGKLSGDEVASSASEEENDKADKKGSKVEENISSKSDDNPFEDLNDDSSSSGGKIKMSAKKEEPDNESATSKFFQQSDDTAVFGEDDDVFVGEIEDNRKSNKVMIGDGEEEGTDDFEFL